MTRMKLTRSSALAGMSRIRSRGDYVIGWEATAEVARGDRLIAGTRCPRAHRLGLVALFWGYGFGIIQRSEYVDSSCGGVRLTKCGSIPIEMVSPIYVFAIQG